MVHSLKNDKQFYNIIMFINLQMYIQNKNNINTEQYTVYTV